MQNFHSYFSYSIFQQPQLYFSAIFPHQRLIKFCYKTQHILKTLHVSKTFGIDKNDSLSLPKGTLTT